MSNFNVVNWLYHHPKLPSLNEAKIFVGSTSNKNFEVIGK